MPTEPTRPSTPQKPPTSPGQQASLRTWVQLAHTHAKIVHRMGHVFTRYGLTSPQFDVLATLHRGEGIMQQELAARLLVTKGNVCGVLDRMEAVGWIERRPDPDDRRANRLHLTEAGRTKFAEVLPEHHVVLHEMMADLQPEEMKTLGQLLKIVEVGIEK